ncbi:MAG: ABC transporter permease [Deltaproteobacteria bacterium]|nr:ABC transporter permease [Deltaproteobacteria bacterium]
MPGALKKISTHRAVIDLGAVNTMDDYGVMLMAKIRYFLNLPDDGIEIKNSPTFLEQTLSQIEVDYNSKCAIARRKPENIIAQFGGTAINTLFDIRFFIAFIGSTVLSLLRVIRSPKALRFDDVLTHMKTTGVDAVPVVALISFLLGLIMAFMSSLQLKPFGANIYVASLVALAMVSELGPIMTAIVVAGRSGSAYAAEISTMKISEEIDALFVMGFDPNLFLVIPRLIAAALVVPLLTAFANLFAIAGGLVIGITMLNLSVTAYVTQTMEALSLFEFSWGLFKSCVFAILIAITGCLRGFQARGGADAVGSAATSAVVSSIFLIVLFDSLFAVIRSYW